MHNYRKENGHRRACALTVAPFQLRIHFLVEFVLFNYFQLNSNYNSDDVRSAGTSSGRYAWPSANWATLKAL